MICFRVCVYGVVLGNRTNIKKCKIIVSLIKRYNFKGNLYIK